MFAEIGKFVGAKVATAVIFLAVAAGGIWCYQNPESVKAFGVVVKHTLIWLVVAAALPWSSYLFMRPLMARQAKMQSAYGAAMVSLGVIAAFWLVDVLLALWLADWSIAGGFTWFVVILGFIAAAAYNFVICESLARHVSA
ncbi:MAG: hypothetical protein DCC65_04075 [Planctomycetota bacterium]|nr:MAG: hypothetical protein DCC65_04075 [Planctomycetota bacterium]